MSTISILTPFKNAASYIGDTADSIFKQTFSDWEWILINDYSEENEEEILGSYLKDPRIKLVPNSGKGIRDALVTGFKLANGTYTTRMDADDIMPENKLELFYSTLLNTDVDIVTGKVRYFSGSGQISPGYLKYEAWLNERVDHGDFYGEIYRECTLSSGNWMMRTDLLKECGGFDALVYPEDYDLLFRWYSNGLSIKGIDEVTHLWREHPMRTSRNSKDYSQERFFDLKIRRFIENDLRDTPLILNGTGTKGRLTARILIEKGIPFEWVSAEPEKFGAGVYGKKVIGVNEFFEKGDLQILNATSVKNSDLHKLYSVANRVQRMVQL
jgi:glycosyltransferase involved in cell wall biosynthesis